MKLKFIKFIAASAIAVTAFIGMVSFVATDEDEEARWRETKAGPCFFMCQKQNPDGTWDSWYVNGGYIDCPRINTESYCDPQACYPDSPCDPR
jgi:hypothetical protein